MKPGTPSLQSTRLLDQLWVFTIKVLYLVSKKLQARIGHNLSFNDMAAIARVLPALGLVSAARGLRAVD